MIILTDAERYDLIDTLIKNMETWEIEKLLEWARPAYENYLQDYEDEELVELSSCIPEELEE